MCVCVCVCVCVFTPPLPWDGGTAWTAIQVHAVNLIDIRLDERWQPISNQSWVTGSPTTNKTDCHWWVPKSRLTCWVSNFTIIIRWSTGGATCLPHKGGGVPLSALPKDTTSKLAGLFSTLSLFYAERQAGKLWIPVFKVFWYDSTWGMNPRSTDYNVDALTTAPSRI